MKLIYFNFFVHLFIKCVLLGSGLVSQSRYSYGFFSAAIKLPTGLSPGVVVAFYVS